jgi:hypothetical protein
VQFAQITPSLIIPVVPKFDSLQRIRIQNADNADASFEAAGSG